MAGLIGAGIGAYLSSSSRDAQEQKREAFRGRLKDIFSRFGLTLLVSNLGRASQNVPFWHLVVETPSNEVVSVRIPLSSASIDPYSDEALNQIIGFITNQGPVHA